MAEHAGTERVVGVLGLQGDVVGAIPARGTVVAEDPDGALERDRNGDDEVGRAGALQVVGLRLLGEREGDRAKGSRAHVDVFAFLGRLVDGLLEGVGDAVVEEVEFLLRETLHTNRVAFDHRGRL